jgi:zinc transporter 1/2/3
MASTLYGIAHHLAFRQEITNETSSNGEPPEDDDSHDECGPGGGSDTYFHLRIAAIFVILVGSMFGALFPVLAKRSSFITIPKSVFEYVLPFVSTPSVIHLVFP